MTDKQATVSTAKTRGDTAPLVEWTDDLRTGLEDVDHQHRRLIEIIHELDDLQAGEASPKELIGVYGKLKNYTLYHFSHEEALLDTWPVNETNKQAHIQEHQEFIDRISRIDKLIDHYPVHVVDHLLAYLVKWLTKHIAGTDLKMGKEIQALQSGQTIDPASLETISPGPDGLTHLYDDIGIRSLDILELNLQLQKEIDLRKQAEEEAQLAALVFHNTSEAMTITDADNKIIAVNPAFTNLTGYEPEEVLGKDPGILSSGKHDEAFYKEMCDSLQETGHWDGELWNRHKNGRVFAETLVINTIYKPDGHVDRYVAVFSDITDKKIAEKKIAQQADELRDYVEQTAMLNIRLAKEVAVKNRLFSIIAHDLRSPFTTLNGLTKRLTDKADNYSKDVLVKKTETIHRAASSIFNVVENLLDWSRAQLSGERIDIQPVRLNDAVDHAIEVVHTVAG